MGAERGKKGGLRQERRVGKGKGRTGAQVGVRGQGRAERREMGVEEGGCGPGELRVLRVGRSHRENGRGILGGFSLPDLNEPYEDIVGGHWGEESRGTGRVGR